MPGTTTTATTTTTMEMDADINDILREVITFLECLRDAQLPFELENLREKLLERSKSTLSAINKTSSSPEPYLDMNSGPKTILLTKNVNDSEEYVGMEESLQEQNHQDYYETFEHESQPKMMAPIAAENVEKSSNEQDDGESSQTLINIYKNLSAAQSKSKCHKCGPLHRKEGKKLFMSENRACWIALVGSHMLMYRSERQSRPSAIYSIRGYMARPAPNLLTRQKGDLAFEIYCPGNETLQFIARTPKDMHQWVAKVCEIGCSNEVPKDGDKDGNENNASSETSVNRREDNATSPRRHKADKSTDNMKKKSPAKREAKSNRNAGKDTMESPPPLPTRIPRRLPSIPDDSVPSYKAIEDYDDNDDIYYKIDDLNDKMAYQNVMLAKRQCVNIDDNEHEKTAEYDDVSASKRGKKEQGQEEKSTAISVEEELYDDIFVLSRDKANTDEEKVQEGDRPVTVDDGEESFYDDVKNLLEKSTKGRAKDQTEASSRFPQKKSFLERVWSRKELPGKTDKKLRGKVSSSPIPSPLATEVMPTITMAMNCMFDLKLQPETLADNGEEELQEYNCLPPPRPVCMKSLSTVNQVDPNSPEELYDDIGTCREKYNKDHQATLELCANVKEAENDVTELRTNGEFPEEDVEHYQSPRSDLRVCEASEYQNEELYDDIALSVKFKARQRDVNEKRDTEDKSIISSDKKSWNRFTGNRNRRTGEPACLAETNRRNTNDSNEMDDLAEANGIAKRNTFQRLINKMENSLAKVTVRGPSSFPTKPNTASNNL